MKEKDLVEMNAKKQKIVKMMKHVSMNNVLIWVKDLKMIKTLKFFECFKFVNVLNIFNIEYIKCIL